MRLPLTIAVLLCAALAASPCAAAEDVASLCTRYRYEAMCTWARQTADDRFIGYAKRPENFGQTPFDLAFDEWLHAPQKGIDELTREASYYRALYGLVMLEGEFDRGIAALTREQVDWLEGARIAEAQGANAVDLLAAAAKDKALRKMLHATKRATREAVYSDPIITVVSYMDAINSDAETLMMAPLVSANHSVEIIQAIKASTGDAELARACDAVTRELTRGREEYASRLLVLAADGKLMPLLEEAAAKASLRGIGEAIGPLLKGLGMKASAGPAVGTALGSCFAAFVAGVEAGWWLTGETAAYEHARLAHFAAFIQPGLGERWFKLKGDLRPDDADLCADFDATTRALVLLNAYVNRETASMADAYAHAVVKLSGWKSVSTLPMEGYLKTYRQWDSGELFARDDDEEQVTAGDLSTPGNSVGEKRTGPDGGTYVWVPPGSFMMGADDLGDDCKPVHRVNITQGFWISQCEVTNAQYAKFLNALGPNIDRERMSLRDCCHIQALGGAYAPEVGWELHPVQCAPYGDKAYCDRYGLSLPTEAEWEYAARGPQNARYPWGDRWDETKCCNWYNRGDGGETFPVGSFPQGASWCGALDMAGNVWEQCSDRWQADYYAISPANDPSGPTDGSYTVYRGGCWFYHVIDFKLCRSAFRDWYAARRWGDCLGFRPVSRPGR